MNLQQGLIDTTYIIQGLDLPLKLGRRLEALGMTDGTRVTILNKKRAGAVIIKVRGTRFAVGKAIAQNIRVG